MRNLKAKRKIIYLGFLLVSICCTQVMSQQKKAGKAQVLSTIKAVNEEELKKGNKTIAIVGATLIDGNGGPPLTDACVVIQGNKITAVGKNGAIKVPQNAETVDAKGLYLLPGLIDSHFHLDESKKLPHQFLLNGVTSVRDPGQWIEKYDEERASGYSLPRLFLTGPHLDMPPPAYPNDAYIIRDAQEAVKAVNKFADQGSTAIKAYFRIPVGMMEKICEAAHKRGIPVTTHLETVDARDAIMAGVDGIEHVTSLGMSLSPAFKAEQYKQAVLADNNARRKGRYEIWRALNMNSKTVDSLITFMKEHQTYLSPTLAVFEYRLDNGKSDTTQWEGFRNMMAFVGKARKGGVRVVVGSHSMVPYAAKGWAYQREMELMAESGMNTSDIIVAATMQNARFFRISDRLGSIEKGKLADLILVTENPLTDIKAMRNIHSVMLNGTWITPD